MEHIHISKVKTNKIADWLNAGTALELNRLAYSVNYRTVRQGAVIIDIVGRTYTLLATDHTVQLGSVIISHTSYTMGGLSLHIVSHLRLPQLKTWTLKYKNLLICLSCPSILSCWWCPPHIHPLPTAILEFESPSTSSHISSITPVTHVQPPAKQKHLVIQDDSDNKCGTILHWF